MRERIARIGQKEIADQSQIEKTKINRLVSGQAGVFLDEIHDFLAALGLAVIESDDSEIVSLPRTEYEALCALARKSLAEVK